MRECVEDIGVEDIGGAGNSLEGTKGRQTLPGDILKVQL